jgi:hypothetical protein
VPLKPLLLAVAVDFFLSPGSTRWLKAPEKKLDQYLLQEKKNSFPPFIKPTIPDMLDLFQKSKGLLPYTGNPKSMSSVFTGKLSAVVKGRWPSRQADPFFGGATLRSNPVKNFR